MIWRTCLVLLLAWAGGFGLFLLSLGKPLDNRKTDGIVVLTGGPGRIDRGLSVLRAGDARRMLVSGVDPDVRQVEFAVQFKIDRQWMACCIDLGWQAIDTRSNGEETAKWVQQHGFKSVRLVTTDWHMPRAKMELANAIGGGVDIIGDGVRSGPNSPGWNVLLREYHKFLVRRIALWLGAG